MPFWYPSRLIVECKAYDWPIWLNIARSTLALREDVNNFEIITEKMVNQRKNNRRKNLAISNRERYFYQVWIAWINKFTKPAIEFSINNKIPLLSLNILFKRGVLVAFFDVLKERFKWNLKNLYNELKRKDYHFDNQFELSPSNDVKKIIDESFIAINEFWDYFILKYEWGANSRHEIINILNNANSSEWGYRIHWSSKEDDLWKIDINDQSFIFYLPEQIKNIWSMYNNKKSWAIDIKWSRFAKLYIFTGEYFKSHTSLTIDSEWLSSVWTNSKDGAL